MKKVIRTPFGMLSLIFFCACSGDVEEINHRSAIPFTLKTAMAVGNTANPYDNIGEHFTSLLSNYKMADYSPLSYPDVTAIVGVLTKDQSIDEELLEEQELLSLCVSHPYDTTDSLLDQSGLSQQARIIVSGLIGDFDQLSAQPFDVSYLELVTREEGINASVTLTQREKRVALSLASVIRHSLYHSCCEDTDWEKSVGNIAAALAGGLENDRLLVAYPLATSIISLEEIDY